MAAKPKPPGGTGKWDKEAKDISSKLYPPTKIEGQGDKVPLSEQSFFDVWLIELNREDREPPVIISGNDAQIALQASLLRALDQILTGRGVGAFDFEAWKNAFENGFSDFTTNASDALKKQWQKEVWPGVTKENSPKIVELKLDGRKKVSVDFHVVQFFPDRKVKSEWKVFSGSYREIAWQITNWWNQGKSEEGASTGKSDVIKRSGHPEVTLYFRQETGIEAGFQPVKGTISFDLMDFTDNPSMAGNEKGKFELITEKDISNLGKRISTIFRTNPPYKWQKGKKHIAYHDWSRGYNFLIYCSTHAEGERLANAVLSIQNHKLDESFLKQGEAKNPTKAYPPSKEITVMGKKHRTPRMRPNAEVVYQYAKIYLPTIKESRTIA